MNRGDIWLINLGGRIGNRPVVVLTRQNVLDYLNKVTVAEITTKGKGYPTEIYVGQVDNIHTVSKERLEKYVGTLDKDSMLEISHKVVLALELESCLYES